MPKSCYRTRLAPELSSHRNRLPLSNHRRRQSSNFLLETRTSQQCDIEANLLDNIFVTLNQVDHCVKKLGKVADHLRALLPQTFVLLRGEPRKTIHEDC